MMFKRNQPKSDNANSNSKKVEWGKISTRALLFLVIGAILVYGGFQCVGFYQRLAGSWNEIVFAYQKPVLVKTMRVAYEEKQKAVEESFLTSTESAEQKLLKEVAEQLKDSRLK